MIPTPRFLIVPLGAICTLATLASQSPQLRARHDGAAAPVRERVADCSLKSPSDLCVLAPGELR
ncbi:MAG: hypothetical protein AB1586_01765 [Pseudomonadota bacterium]